MTYAAPLDEMRFVLNRLAGLPEIATFPGYEEAEPELIEAILTEAARFATEVLAPLNATGDARAAAGPPERSRRPIGGGQGIRQSLSGSELVPRRNAEGGSYEHQASRHNRRRHYGQRHRAGLRSLRTFGRSGRYF